MSTRRMSVALGCGTILQGLNSSLIAVALPAIGDFYHNTSATSLMWVVSALYLTAAIGSPTAGRLGDLFGHRRVFLSGLVIVLIAAVLGPLSPNLMWIAADRALLGIGTSFQFPAAMAIIQRQCQIQGVSSAVELGTLSVLGLSSTALGPAVGGLLVAAFGWKSVFWVNVPVVVFAMWMVLSSVPADSRLLKVRRGSPRLHPIPSMDKDSDSFGSVGALHRFLAQLRHAAHAIDLGGVALFGFSIFAIMAALSIHGGMWVLLAGIILMVVFAVFEQRRSTRFIDFEVFLRHPVVLHACFSAFLNFTGFYVVFYGLPQILQNRLNLDSAAIGLVMSPIFAVAAISTLLASRRSKHGMNPFKVMIWGNMGMLIGGALLAVAMNSTKPIIVILAVTALMGVPNGLNNLGNQYLLNEGAPPDVAGTAAGLYRTFQFLGAAFSGTLLSVIIPKVENSGSAFPLGIVVVVIAVILLGDSVVSIVRGGKRSETSD